MTQRTRSSDAGSGNPERRKKFRNGSWLLGDLQIINAFDEKNAIEGGYGGLYLLAIAEVESGRWTREQQRQRTIEVYRRCYEESKSDLVLRDFVAHHVDLICESPWFAEVLKKAAAPCEPARMPARKRILLSIANGFRAAANPKPSENRILRRSRVEGTRIVAYSIQRELAAWGDGLDLKHAEDQWAGETVDKKVKELVTQYQKVRGSEGKLRAALLARHYYQAAILIASKTFDVRVRDLEERPPAARTVKPPHSR